jgi:predicted amidohydrolase YtcJ
MLKLDACKSVEECLELLAKEANRTRGPWVLAIGARVESWSDPRWPTCDELDRISRPRPVCVMSFDHHAVAANSAALHAAGLLNGPDPAAGVVCRGQRGEPTGLLLEAAAHQLWNAAPEPSPQERKEHVQAALHDLAVHGFTEVHDLLSPSWLGPLLCGLDGTGLLRVPVHLYVPVAEIEAQHEAAKRWHTERVRLAGAKVFADGTLNSKTAWMLDPYADPLPGMERGKVITTPEEIRAARERTLALGLGLAVHAIGDAAVRAVLRVEEGIKASSRHDTAPKLRIEHCELIDREDVPRFADLGVVASVQPCHLLADIEVLRRQLSHRLDRVLPLRELIDAGCAPGEGLIFGSDAPIVRPHPQDSIQAAVYRRREGMNKQDAIAPEQAITEAEAWAAFGLS